MVDFNELERVAEILIQSKNYNDALRIYFYMSDGDPSMDGGYLAKRLAECYEAMHDLVAARYWYGKAIEENPIVNEACKKEYDRLGEIKVEDLVAKYCRDNGAARLTSKT